MNLGDSHAPSVQARIFPILRRFALIYLGVFVIAVLIASIWKVPDYIHLGWAPVMFASHYTKYHFLKLYRRPFTPDERYQVLLGAFAFDSFIQLAPVPFLIRSLETGTSYLLLIIIITLLGQLLFLVIGFTAGTDRILAGILSQENDGKKREGTEA